MSSEDRLYKMAIKNGWTAEEIGQLRYELWGMFDTPDGFRQELGTPSSVREGIQLLVEEDWHWTAVKYLSSPPYRELAQDDWYVGAMEKLL